MQVDTIRAGPSRTPLLPVLKAWALNSRAHIFITPLRYLATPCLLDGPAAISLLPLSPPLGGLHLHFLVLN